MATHQEYIGKPLTSCIHTDKDQNSLLNNINTGFGPENSLSLQKTCSTTPTVLHLYKENYLSEFETEEDKTKARLNLGVPSVQDVSKQIQLKLQDYATKADVDKVVAGTLSLQNYYTKQEVDTKISNIRLNLDTAPKQGSMNAVTSDGIWKHVDETVGEIHRYTKTI